MSNWYDAYSEASCCEAKEINDQDVLFRIAYDELFADRIHKDQHEDRHYYNQLVPDYFSKESKDQLVRQAGIYFDNCVKVASMDRDKFIDSVCKQFETEKEGFERWRNREIIDLLDSLPKNVIRGYLDMKGS